MRPGDELPAGTFVGDGNGFKNGRQHFMLRGATKDQFDSLRFRLIDHINDRTYEMRPFTPVLFVEDSMTGISSQPYILYFSDDNPENDGPDLKPWPNPVRRGNMITPELNRDIEEGVYLVDVLSGSGHSVYQFEMTITHPIVEPITLWRIPFPTDQFIPGLYYISVSKNGGHTSSSRFLILE